MYSIVIVDVTGLVRGSVWQCVAEASQDVLDVIFVL